MWLNLSPNSMLTFQRQPSIKSDKNPEVKGEEWQLVWNKAIPDCTKKRNQLRGREDKKSKHDGPPVGGSQSGRKIHSVAWRREVVVAQISVGVQESYFPQFYHAKEMASNFEDWDQKFLFHISFN